MEGDVTGDGDGDRQEKPSQRGVAAALIVLSRYIAHVSPEFPSYLQQSIAHAASVGVAADDLAILKVMLTAIGEKL